MSNKSKARRALYSEARKYLDIKSILPKSDINWQNLTDYQAKRISQELRHLYSVAGGKHFLEKDFVKVKRTAGAKKYISDSALPKSSKGILLAGGAKINTGVTIRNGGVFFKRGTSQQASFPINATSEKTISASVRKYTGYINNPDNVSYIGTAGGKVQGVNILHKNNKWQRVKVSGADAELEEEKAVDDIERVAVSLFIKYAAMANNGEYRMQTEYQRRKGLKGRLAAHPSKWGMNLIVEAK